MVHIRASLDRDIAGSIGLPQAGGFTRVGLLPAVGFKFGRWVDSVLMPCARVAENGAVESPPAS